MGHPKQSNQVPFWGSRLSRVPGGFFHPGAAQTDAGAKIERRCCLSEIARNISARESTSRAAENNIARSLRRRWFAAPPDGNCRRAHRRGGGLEAPLGATASRMFAFPPPGGQFRLTNNRAGLANAAGRLLSPASLASRPRKRSVPAERKQWRFCSHGAVAQSYRHH